MNRLSNGAIAVGSEGCLMRLVAAYEHELEREFDSGKVFLYERERIPEMARKMIYAASTRGAIIGPAFAAAAKACGITKPTAKTVQTYICAAGFDMVHPDW